MVVQFFSLFLLLIFVLNTGLPYQSMVLLPGGDFEPGSGKAWQEYSEQGEKIIYPANQLPAGIFPKSGNRVAWLGGENDELAYIRQTVNVPGGTPMLVFWFLIHSIDTCGSDSAQLLVNDVVWSIFDLCRLQNSPGWTSVLVNMEGFANQVVDIRIQAETDSRNLSSFFVDDVAWEIQLPPTPVVTASPLPILTKTSPTEISGQGRSVSIPDQRSGLSQPPFEDATGIPATAPNQADINNTTAGVSQPQKNTPTGTPIIIIGSSLLNSQPTWTGVPDLQLVRVDELEKPNDSRAFVFVIIGGLIVAGLILVMIALRIRRNFSQP